MQNATVYIERVAAFEEGRYVNIHWKGWRDDGHVMFPGSAHQDVREAVKSAMYWAYRGHDVYLAQGSAINCKPSARGPYRRAMRGQYNIGSCRSLYMDVDVKQPEENETEQEKIKRENSSYLTRQEASRAVSEFLDVSGLPMANVAVSSGTGGFHLYWVFTRLITPGEFFDLSRRLVNCGKHFGFKSDWGCTIDSCRLLRVPDTFNFKTNPASPVQLSRCVPGNFEPEHLAEILGPYQESAPNPRTRSGGHVHHANGGGTSEDKNPFGDFNSQSYAPSKWDDIEPHCEFLRQTRIAGGEGYDEPLWKQCISLATYFEDGRALAHELSSGHISYSPSETDEKFDQAERDKANNSKLGPTSCKTLSDYGAQGCATCPHFAQNSTPLSSHRKINGHPVLSPRSPPSYKDLPEGYWRGEDDEFIYANGEVDKDTGAIENVCVFPFPIVENSSFVEVHNGRPYRMMFLTPEGNNPRCAKIIDCNDAKSLDTLTGKLLSIGLPHKATAMTQKFFITLQRHCTNNSKTLISAPAIGWHNDDGVMGFSFDGEFVSPKGTFKCHMIDPAGAEYRVKGGDAEWREATKYMVDVDRPDLAILLSSAFSAPLVAMCGQSGFIMGCYGDSGIGKSTAVTLSQSVWGAPINISGLNDTTVNLFGKAAIIRNLPLIIDEIKTTAQIMRFSDIILQMTSGRDKGRGRRDGTPGVTRSWQTLMMYCCNPPMVDHILEYSKGTNASLFRVFEFHGLQHHNAASTTQVANLVAAAHANYGVIGKQYARFLGENYNDVYTRLRGLQEKLEVTLRARPDERFWVASIAVTIVGAWLAKELGYADFNLTSMRDYMVKTLEGMREGKIIVGNDYSDTSAVLKDLAMFLGENRENTVITDVAWMQRGRPHKGAVKILNPKNWDKDSADIQISLNPYALRFTDSLFGTWCRDAKVPKSSLTEALKTKFGANCANGRVASGTKLAGLTQPVWVVPITGSDLEKECEWAEQYKP